MRFWNNIEKYLDIIIAVVIGYVLVKFIDNYSYFFQEISSVVKIVSPFIYAFIIAYILNPLMSFFERRLKLKRIYSLILTYTMIIGLIILLAIYFIPELVTSILDMIKNAPQFMTDFQGWVDNILKHEDVQNIKQYLNFDTSFITSKGTTIVINILNTFMERILSFTNIIIKWVFGFIISIYVLADKERFIKAIKKITIFIFKEKNGNNIIKLVSNLDRMIGVYIGIKAIDSMIIGIIAFIGLSILGSPYVLVLALVVGITNMIPYFGPFIGMSVAFIINIFISPFKALLVLVFLFLLQQFDGWYLDPKLIGGKVGLSPFLIILAVTIGGGLYGVLGMILAVPIMAVVKIYLDKLLNKSIE
ncbi:AI-2E family transporter [Clostridium hydrogeniformans]|uniref:AI-2E family transporter n=1 Tax=Clostridium hydrogeniformans TaxID=349933 RepID=UPI000488FEAA|nr:AI-2E family transporter [Clostridium hydrogeniformans]